MPRIARNGGDRSGGKLLSSRFQLIILGVCLLGAGCAAPTVWKVEVRSSDGFWIASARTVQNGGFGTAAIDTAVFLKCTRDASPPQQVLGFSCEGPVSRSYVPDNKANAGGTINLTMKWLAPSHLEVTYNGRDGSLNFQVVKYQGIDISVRDLSGETTDTTDWK
jgi:hypothetical protein